MAYYQPNDYLRYGNTYQNNNQYLGNPPMQQNQMQNQQYNQYPQQSNGIIWVQGESGAKSYLVAPNCTVQLWDSESQTIYIKSADASGMPSIKILDYTIRNNGKETENVINQGKIENVGNMKTEIKALYEKIENLEDEMKKLRNNLSNKSNGNNHKRGAKLNKDE